MNESATEPIYKFELNQIVRLKYVTHIFVFLVAHEFDAKVGQIFYHGRVFADGKIQMAFTKFAELELEIIPSEEPEGREEVILADVDFQNHKDEIVRILTELAGSASMCWKPIPKGVFDSTKTQEFVDAAVSDLAKLFLPKGEVSGSKDYEDTGTVLPAAPTLSGEGSEVASKINLPSEVPGATIKEVSSQ